MNRWMNSLMTILVRNITQCYTIWSLETFKSRVLCGRANSRNTDMTQCNFSGSLLKLKIKSTPRLVPGLGLWGAHGMEGQESGDKRHWRLHLGVHPQRSGTVVCWHYCSPGSIFGTLWIYWFLGPTPKTQRVSGGWGTLDQSELGIAEILTSPEEKFEC